MKKDNLVVGVVSAVVVVLLSVFFLGGDDSAPVGAVAGTDVYNDMVFIGSINEKRDVVDVTTTAVTLSASQSGALVNLTSTGTVALPAVSNEGTHYTFVVGSALGAGNTVIDSAEGDNIEGALIVAGAVVDCAAEDQINFVTDGENIGDFVELYSNGTNWLIGKSGGLTAAKITCTDPS